MINKWYLGKSQNDKEMIKKWFKKKTFNWIYNPWLPKNLIILTKYCISKHKMGILVQNDWHLMGVAPVGIATLVEPFLVVISYIELVNGGYKPTNMTGVYHHVDFIPVRSQCFGKILTIFVVTFVSDHKTKKNNCLLSLASVPISYGILYKYKHGT